LIIMDVEMSVNEMSHRSKIFDDIIQTAESDIRDLYQIPDNYKVYFYRAEQVNSLRLSQ